MKKLIFVFVVGLILIALQGQLKAQTWNTTGNAGTTPGTNFIGTTDAKDFVFKTNGVEKGRVKSNGLWQFGAAGNIAKIDSAGNLTFAGTSAYKVAGNKYAFQYSGNPNYGLFFNSTSLLYEFRTSTALPIFSIGANSGNGIFTGNLKIGAYTLPATDGTSGQVLKSNGLGVLTWSADIGTSYSAGTGINIAAGVISNTGDTNAGDDLTTASTAGGDVSGLFSALSVNKIKGVTVSATSPTNTQVLKYNSATTSWEPATDANTTYTAGTGLTLTSTTFYNNLSTGVAGGQNIFGGTAAGNNLILNSTTNATKGNIYFGSSSVYDEVNGRLGIGTTTPSSTFAIGANKLNASGADGDLSFSDDLGSITFAVADVTNSPMIQMFASGTNNGDRMVVAHSSAFPTWGLQYQDGADKFNFIGGQYNPLTVDLANNRVGIGTNTPLSPLHIYSGTAVSLSSTGYFLIGVPTSSNIVMDNAVIQSRYNGAGATLYLNYYGGGTRIGSPIDDMVDISDNGNVGIGTYSSSQKVNIQGLTTSTDNVLYVKGNYSGGNSDVVGINCVSQISDGFGIGITTTGGYKGIIATANAGAYTGSAFGVIGTSNGTAGTRYGVYGTASGGTINWAGYFYGNTYATTMAIGTTTSATGYTLSVNGKLICTEARVATFATWPDFVFKKDYHLMPIKELEKNIISENHLPGIPSATEIECEGFDLGDMQAKLLLKIEELSLYVIDLNKQNEELKARIDKLENK